MAKAPEQIASEYKTFIKDAGGRCVVINERRRGSEAYRRRKTTIQDICTRLRCGVLALR